MHEHIDAFIEDHNENARPFEWRKVNVKSNKLENKFPNLYKWKSSYGITTDHLIDVTALSSRSLFELQLWQILIL
jgi:hypothetical protein